MKVVRELNERQWRSFIENHPDTQVFHAPEMFEVFRRAAGYQPELWAAVDSREEVNALLLPVRLTLFNGIASRLTSRDVVFGGILSTPGPDGSAALKALLERYRQTAAHRVLFTEVRNLFDVGQSEPILLSSGFRHEDHLNYLINLDRPAEDILQDIGPRTRKHVRRGLRSDEITVGEMESRDQIPIVYDVLQQTYAKARVPLADQSLFTAAYDVLHPKGMVRFTLARVQGFVAAVSVELLYHGVMYGWYGGTLREYSKHQPNEILTWHLLEWGSKSGYRVYDFGGAGNPNEEYGVRDFKAKFGGRLVCYGRDTCIHSHTLLQVSKFGYSVYRQVNPKRSLALSGFTGSAGNSPTGNQNSDSADLPCLEKCEEGR